MLQRLMRYPTLLDIRFSKAFVNAVSLKGKKLIQNAYFTTHTYALYKHAQNIIYTVQSNTHKFNTSVKKQWFKCTAKPPQ